jgi:16S rRNA U1498 N3-methylase RsmE
VPTLHTYITLSDLLKFVQLSPESADSTDGSNSFPRNVLNLFQTIFVCVERSDGNNQHLLTSFQQFITESGSSSGDSGSGSGSGNNSEVRPFAILIGPEGGFTAEEMEQIRLVQSISPNKIRLVSLGGTVLTVRKMLFFF